jgi:shikimate kinase
MNAYLCGIMGSGKSSLGRLAAGNLGLEFMDMDQEIDRRLGHSFHQLVAQKGWLPFREMEYQVCRDVATKSGVLLALGGGTVRYQWNMDVLKGTGPIVLLSAPLEVLQKRVESAQRPRVTANQDLRRELSDIWERSGPKYLEAADLVIKTHPKTKNQAATDLTLALKKLLKL